MGGEGSDVRAGAVLRLLLEGLERGPTPGLPHLLLGYDVENGVAGELPAP